MEELANTHTKLATSKTPALIIYLIDVSASMGAGFASADQRRIDVAVEALHSAVETMVFRSTKGGSVSPRYRIALLAYSNDVYDLFGGVRTVTEVAQRGIPKLRPLEKTFTEKGLREVLKILESEVPLLSERHPAPLVCHLTDGEYNGEDPQPVAESIRGLTSPDGNVLLQNIYISDHLAERIEDVQAWRGLKPGDDLGEEYANKLLRMSSVMPKSYWETFAEYHFRLEPGSALFFPGDPPELMQVAFQMSAATPYA